MGSSLEKKIMKLSSALGFLALSNAAPNCEVTESATCPCSLLKYKKAKIGNRSASAIQKRGQGVIEMRVTVMNHILDKDATKYPDAYQGDWTFRHPTYGKNKGDAGVLTGSTNLVSSPKRYNPNFHIFLQWSRNNCGLEFLDAIESGDVQFDVMDQYDVYNTREMSSFYNKWENDSSVNKKYWTQVKQFRYTFVNEVKNR